MYDVKIALANLVNESLVSNPEYPPEKLESIIQIKIIGNKKDMNKIFKLRVFLVSLRFVTSDVLRNFLRCQY